MLDFLFKYASFWRILAVRSPAVFAEASTPRLRLVEFILSSVEGLAPASSAPTPPKFPTKNIQMQKKLRRLDIADLLKDFLQNFCAAAAGQGERILIFDFIIALLFTITLISQCSEPAQRFMRIAKNETVETTLGYNPHILFVESRHDKNNGAFPTIYLHGFGDNSAHFYTYLRSIADYFASPYLLSIPAIFFDFADAGINADTTIAQKFEALSHSNMGQSTDILSFAHILNSCRKTGYKAVDLYGFSRGAATILTTLAAFVEKKYPHEFAALGIHDTEQSEIMEMVKRGCITLDCPLKHLSQQWENNCGNLIGPLVTNFILPCFTHYNPEGDHALDALDKLVGQNFKMLIHYEKGDMVVTNWADRLFYEKALRIGKYIFLLKSEDGGHTGIRAILPSVFFAFKRCCGFCPFSISFTKAVTTLVQHRPDPETVEDR